jgi:hypothetical protein
MFTAYMQQDTRQQPGLRMMRHGNEKLFGFELL